MVLVNKVKNEVEHICFTTKRCKFAKVTQLVHGMA